MKKILFISDVFSKGGLETRIYEETTFLKKQHIDSYLICDKFDSNTYSTNFREIVSGINLEPINKSLTGKQILQTANKISDFCLTHEIDLIECQPFWCLLPATLTAKKCNIPITYTIHGSKSGNFINLNSIDASLFFYLCLYKGIDAIIPVSEYLSHLYRHLPQNHIITPNAIDISNLKSKKTINKSGHFAIASRIEHPKTDTIFSFLPQLYNSHYTRRIDIYGDGTDRLSLEEFIKNNHYDNKVNLCGWAENLPDILKNNNYDCIFGLGRGFAGIVNKQNLKQFANSNFISWDKTSPNLLDQELKQLYKNPANYLFSKTDLKQYSSDNVWGNHANEITTLKHSSNQTVDDLEQLLITHNNNNLLFGNTLFEPLLQIIHSLGDDELVYTGYINYLLSEYYKLTNINEQLKTEVKNMQESTSWRITKPLRKINQHISRHN